MEKYKIILFNANPKDTINEKHQPLRLDELVNRVENVRVRGKYRDCFEVHSNWATKPEDFRHVLLNNEDTIGVLQFSGHGDRAQFLLFENRQGNAQRVKAKALGEFFEILPISRRPKCVFLAACYSDDVAEAIAKHVDFVIGMNAPIEDEAAIVFSEGFYDALLSGYPICSAFDLGKNALAAYNLKEEYAPKIFPEEKLPEEKKGWLIAAAKRLLAPPNTPAKQFTTDLFDIEYPSNIRYASISCDRIPELKRIKHHLRQQPGYAAHHFFVASQDEDKADSFVERFASELVGSGKSVDYLSEPKARYQYLRVENLPIDDLNFDRSQQLFRRYFVDRYQQEIGQNGLELESLEDFFLSEIPSLQKDYLIVAFKLPRELHSDFLDRFLQWIIQDFCKGKSNHLKILFFYLLPTKKKVTFFDRIFTKNNKVAHLLQQVNRLKENHRNCCCIDKMSRVKEDDLMDWFGRYSKQTFQVEQKIIEARTSHSIAYDSRSASFSMYAVEDFLKKVLEKEKPPKAF